MDRSDRPVPMLDGEHPGRIGRSDSLRWMGVYLELVRGLDDLAASAEPGLRLRRVREVFLARAEFWRAMAFAPSADPGHDRREAEYPV